VQRRKFEAFAVSGDGRSGSLPLPDQRVAFEGLRKSAIGRIFFGKCLINDLPGKWNYFRFARDPSGTPNPRFPPGGVRWVHLRFRNS